MSLNEENEKEDALNSAIESARKEADGTPMRRVSAACLACRKSHVCCDNKRPCGRCQARGVECVDTESRKRGPKKAKKNRSNEESADLSVVRHKEQSTEIPLPINRTESFPHPSVHYVNNNGVMNRMLPPLSSPSSPPAFLPPTSPSIFLPPHFPTSPGNAFNGYIPMNFSNNQREEYRRLPLPTSPWRSDQPESFAKSPNQSVLPSPGGSSEDQRNYELDLEEMLNTTTFGSNLFESSSQDQSSPLAVEGQEAEEDIIPPSFYIRDANSFEQIHEIFRRKKVQVFKNKEEWARIHKKIEDLRRFITKEQKKMLIKEFWSQLREMERGASSIETAVIIHERSGFVHYTNQAFLDIIGHKKDLENLNPFKGQLIYEHVSANSINSFMCFLPFFFLATEVKSVRVETELKISGTGEKTGIEERYVSGISTITIKRDIFGLPQLFVSHFMPYLNSKTGKEHDKAHLFFPPPYEPQRMPGSVPYDIYSSAPK